MSRHHHAHNASRAGMRRPAASPPRARPQPRPQPRPGWPAGAVRLRTRTAAQTLPRHAARADPCGVKAASGGHSSSRQPPQSLSPPVDVHHDRRAWSGESEANAGVFVRLPEWSRQSAEGRSSPVIPSRWRVHRTAFSLSAPSGAFHIPQTSVARANPRFAWVALEAHVSLRCTCP